MTLYQCIKSCMNIYIIHCWCLYESELIFFWKRLTLFSADLSLIFFIWFISHQYDRHILLRVIFYILKPLIFNCIKRFLFKGLPYHWYHTLKGTLWLPYSNVWSKKQIFPIHLYPKLRPSNDSTFKNTLGSISILLELNSTPMVVSKFWSNCLPRYRAKILVFPTALLPTNTILQHLPSNSIMKLKELLKINIIYIQWKKSSLLNGLNILVFLHGSGPVATLPVNPPASSALPIFGLLADDGIEFELFNALFGHFKGNHSNTIMIALDASLEKVHLFDFYFEFFENLLKLD